jgi:hypothetical protein
MVDRVERSQFDRVAEAWSRSDSSPTSHDDMQKLRGDRLVGRIFAASRAKLREIADRIGVRHLLNLTGCPIR